LVYASRHASLLPRYFCTYLADLRARKDDSNAFFCLLFGSVSGKALFRSNDHDAARLKYQEAKDLSENALQPMEGLAEIEASEGNFSQAIEIYTELVNLYGH
jgi:tetratricopeptide (TPR) repeat protein